MMSYTLRKFLKPRMTLMTTYPATSGRVIEQSLPGAGAVDVGGLVDLARDREQPGDVDEQRAGDRLPGRDDDDGEPGEVGVGEDALAEPRDAERRPDAGSEFENRKLKT